MATLAWFLAAARTSDGPPMSISSTSASSVDPGPLGGGRERIEVDDDELERARSPAASELAPVVGQPEVGEDAAVDRAGGAS